MRDRVEKNRVDNAGGATGVALAVVATVMAGMCGIAGWAAASDYFHRQSSEMRIAAVEGEVKDLQETLNGAHRRLFRLEESERRRALQEGLRDRERDPKRPSLLSRHYRRLQEAQRLTDDETGKEQQR